LRFNIEGHTDNTGSAATNNELSLRRAMSARDYLIGQGVASSSIDVDGFGFAVPVGDNSTSDGRARNRRVEIVISGAPLVSMSGPLAAR
jgi:outer membrane protein OmpA-like peptidoglycan-associated protein